MSGDTFTMTGGSVGFAGLYDFEDSEFVGRVGKHEAATGTATAGHDLLANQLL